MATLQYVAFRPEQRWRGSARRFWEIFFLEVRPHVSGSGALLPTALVRPLTVRFDLPKECSYYPSDELPKRAAREPEKDQETEDTQGAVFTVLAMI